MVSGFETGEVWKANDRGFQMGVFQPSGVVVHLTGQVAWTADERIVGVGDIRAQTQQCFRNIEALLVAAGGKLSDVVAITTYFTDRAQLPEIQKVRTEVFASGQAPASTSVMVAGLGHPDFLVELTPIAVIPHENLIAPNALRQASRPSPIPSASVRTNVSSGDPFEDVYGYSRAVRVGDQLHVSGTTAQPPFVKGCDSYIQAKNALEIIERALVEAGSSFRDVVRTVTYVTDMDDAMLVAKAHLEAFETIRPASTIVEVAALDDPERTVEIEVYAVCSTVE